MSSHALQVALLASSFGAHSFLPPQTPLSLSLSALQVRLGRACLYSAPSSDVYLLSEDPIRSSGKCRWSFKLSFSPLATVRIRGTLALSLKLCADPLCCVLGSNRAPFSTDEDGSSDAAFRSSYWEGDSRVLLILRRDWARRDLAVSI